MQNSLYQCLKFIFPSAEIEEFFDLDRDLFDKFQKYLDYFGMMGNMVYDFEELPTKNKHDKFILVGKSANLQKIFAVYEEGIPVFIPYGEPLTEEFIIYFIKKG